MIFLIIFAFAIILGLGGGILFDAIVAVDPKDTIVYKIEKALEKFFQKIKNRHTKAHKP